MATCGAVVPAARIPDVARNQACADCVNLSALLIRATRLRGVLASIPIHDVKQRSFFAPRRVPAPGFLRPLLFASTPNEGRGSAGRRYPHSARSRKGAHHVCETRPFRGKPERASRRSTLAILGPLRARRLRSCLRLRRAGDPRCRVSRPVGEGPEPPGARLRAAAAGRHSPLRLQDRL